MTSPIRPITAAGSIPPQQNHMPPQTPHRSTNQINYHTPTPSPLTHSPEQTRSRFNVETFYHITSTKVKYLEVLIDILFVFTLTTILITFFSYPGVISDFITLITATNGKVLKYFSPHRIDFDNNDIILSEMSLLNSDETNGVSIIQNPHHLSQIVSFITTLSHYLSTTSFKFKGFDIIDVMSKDIHLSAIVTTAKKVLKLPESIFTEIITHIAQATLLPPSKTTTSNLIDSTTTNIPSELLRATPVFNLGNYFRKSNAESENDGFFVHFLTNLTSTPRFFSSIFPIIAIIYILWFTHQQFHKFSNKHGHFGSKLYHFVVILVAICYLILTFSFFDPSSNSTQFTYLQNSLHGFLLYKQQIYQSNTPHSFTNPSMLTSIWNKTSLWYHIPVDPTASHQFTTGWLLPLTPPELDYKLFEDETILGNLFGNFDIIIEIYWNFIFSNIYTFFPIILLLALFGIIHIYFSFYALQLADIEHTPPQPSSLSPPFLNPPTIPQSNSYSQSTNISPHLHHSPQYPSLPQTTPQTLVSPPNSRILPQRPHSSSSIVNSLNHGSNSTKNTPASPRHPPFPLSTSHYQSHTITTAILYWISIIPFVWYCATIKTVGYHSLPAWVLLYLFISDLVTPHITYIIISILCELPLTMYNFPLVYKPINNSISMAHLFDQYWDDLPHFFTFNTILKLKHVYYRDPITFINPSLFYQRQYFTVLIFIVGFALNMLKNILSDVNNYLTFHNVAHYVSNLSGDSSLDNYSTFSQLNQTDITNPTDELLSIDNIRDNNGYNVFGVVFGTLHQWYGEFLRKFMYTDLIFNIIFISLFFSTIFFLILFFFYFSKSIHTSRFISNYFTPTASQPPSPTGRYDSHQQSYDGDNYDINNDYDDIDRNLYPTPKKTPTKRKNIHKNIPTNNITPNLNNNPAHFDSKHRLSPDPSSDLPSTESSDDQSSLGHNSRRGSKITTTTQNIDKKFHNLVQNAGKKQPKTRHPPSLPVTDPTDIMLQLHEQHYQTHNQHHNGINGANNLGNYDENYGKNYGKDDPRNDLAKNNTQHYKGNLHINPSSQSFDAKLIPKFRPDGVSPLKNPQIKENIRGFGNFDHCNSNNQNNHPKINNPNDHSNFSFSTLDLLMANDELTPYEPESFAVINLPTHKRDFVVRDGEGNNSSYENRFLKFEKYSLENNSDNMIPNTNSHLDYITRRDVNDGVDFYSQNQKNKKIGENSEKNVRKVSKNNNTPLNNVLDYFDQDEAMDINIYQQRDYTDDGGDGGFDVEDRLYIQQDERYQYNPPKNISQREKEQLLGPNRNQNQVKNYQHYQTYQTYQTDPAPPPHPPHPQSTLSYSTQYSSSYIPKYNYPTHPLPTQSTTLRLLSSFFLSFSNFSYLLISTFTIFSTSFLLKTIVVGYLNTDSILLSLIPSVFTYSSTFSYPVHLIALSSLSSSLSSSSSSSPPDLPSPNIPSQLYKAFLHLPTLTNLSLLTPMELLLFMNVFSIIFISTRVFFPKFVYPTPQLPNSHLLVQMDPNITSHKPLWFSLMFSITSYLLNTNQGTNVVLHEPAGLNNITNVKKINPNENFDSNPYGDSSSHSTSNSSSDYGHSDQFKHKGNVMLRNSSLLPNNPQNNNHYNEMVSQFYPLMSISTRLHALYSINFDPNGELNQIYNGSNNFNLNNRGVSLDKTSLNSNGRDNIILNDSFMNNNDNPSIYQASNYHNSQHNYIQDTVLPLSLSSLSISSSINDNDPFYDSYQNSSNNFSQNPPNPSTISYRPQTIISKLTNGYVPTPEQLLNLYNRHHVMIIQLHSVFLFTFFLPLIVLFCYKFCVSSYSLITFPHISLSQITPEIELSTNQLYHTTILTTWFDFLVHIPTQITLIFVPFWSSKPLLHKSYNLIPFFESHPLVVIILRFIQTIVNLMLYFYASLYPLLIILMISSIDRLYQKTAKYYSKLFYLLYTDDSLIVKNSYYDNYHQNSNNNNNNNGRIDRSLKRNGLNGSPSPTQHHYNQHYFPQSGYQYSPYEYRDMMGATREEPLRNYQHYNPYERDPNVSMKNQRNSHKQPQRFTQGVNNHYQNDTLSNYNQLSNGSRPQYTGYNDMIDESNRFFQDPYHSQKEQYDQKFDRTNRMNHLNNHRNTPKKYQS